MIVKGNSGEACTSVVTEYHYHAADHIDIRVEVFTMEELQDQLKQLLRSYRHFHMNRGALEQADVGDAESRAALALDTFRAMFGSRVLDEGMLIDDTEEDVLHEISEWADNERPSKESLEYSGMSLDLSLTRLNDLFFKSGSAGQPAAWPFVKCVK